MFYRDFESVYDRFTGRDKAAGVSSTVKNLAKSAAVKGAKAVGTLGTTAATSYVAAGAMNKGSKDFQKLEDSMNSGTGKQDDKKSVLELLSVRLEKLAGSVSTNTLPNLNPVREENLKIPGQSTAKPASGGSKGAYNVQPSQYDDTNKSGKSTLNDISEVVQTETATPGPNGKATSPDGQIHQGLRHAHASVYDTVKISASDSAPAVSGVRTVNGGETVDNSATDNNYANTGQYGDKTTMNTVDFQTNSKVDKLTALSERLDRCIAKTATYNFNPEEGHFQRILRRKGEDALAKGDKTAAVKIAVAMNALDALEKENFDKTAASPTLLQDLKKINLTNIKKYLKNGELIDKAKVFLDRQSAFTNPATAILGGAAATGVAAALPEIDDPKNFITRGYNSLVTHPLRTGIGIGLLSPALTTGSLVGMTQNGPAQTWQNLMALGGAGTLAHTVALPDIQKGPDSELNEYIAGVNRNVPDTTLGNVAKGGAIGGLGGLGLAAAANAVGNLGFGLDDYAKYTLAGAALGAGAGAVYKPLATNYNRDVNYLR